MALAERPVAPCQFTYTSILVAMSRVPSRESIRLLCGDGSNLRNVEYIKRLKPSPTVNAFFSGYDEEGNRWVTERVTTFVRNHLRDFDVGW